MTIKKSNTETGHARNLANFQSLITICTGYGTAYNPANKNLALTALKTLYADVQKNLNTVATALAEYRNTVADRETAFAQINVLTSKIISALKANGTTPATQQNANTVTKRITGRNKTKKAKPVTGEPTEKTISTSQLSYDRKLDNLNQLIQILKTEPNYKPNEAELKLDTLTKLSANLIAKNNNVIAKATALSNARLVRNQKTYAENGLNPIGNSAKAYVKSVFGPKSPQYKQLTGIQFKAVHQ